MKTIIYTLFLISFLPGFVLGLEVTFKKDAVVSSPMLTLGDVADIDSDETAGELSGVVLFDAPDQGEHKCYGRSVLQAYVRNAVSGKIVFGGADTVCVRHEGELLEQNEIVKMINARLKASLRHMDAKNVLFVPRNSPEALNLPPGHLEYEVLFSNADIISSRQATVIIKVDGRVLHNLSVAGEVQAYLPVVLASRRLERGTVLGREHVRTEMKNINGLRDPCTDINDVIGKKLKRPVEMNRVLGKKDLDFPLLVERRQIITMIADKGALQISTSGEAISGGREGDTIMVKNLRSNREIPGRVTGPGLVTVDF